VRVEVFVDKYIGLAIEIESRIEKESRIEIEIVINLGILQAKTYTKKEAMMIMKDLKGIVIFYLI